MSVKKKQALAQPKRDAAIINVIDCSCFSSNKKHLPSKWSVWLTRTPKTLPVWLHPLRHCLLILCERATASDFFALEVGSWRSCVSLLSPDCNLYAHRFGTPSILALVNIEWDSCSLSSLHHCLYSLLTACTSPRRNQAIDFYHLCSSALPAVNVWVAL